MCQYLGRLWVTNVHIIEHMLTYMSLPIRQTSCMLIAVCATQARVHHQFCVSRVLLVWISTLLSTKSVTYSNRGTFIVWLANHFCVALACSFWGNDNVGTGIRIGIYIDTWVWVDVWVAIGLGFQLGLGLQCGLGLHLSHSKSRTSRPF